MKIIITEQYDKLVFAQLLEEDKENSLLIDKDNNNLPVIKEEDIHSILEDDIEIGDEIVPEGSPITEQPLDVEKVEETEKAPLFNNKFDAIDWAIDNNKTININYVTKKGTGVNRKVEPHGTFYAKTTHNTILVTFDQTIDAIRAFIITNINGLNFTGEDFNKKFIVSIR